MIGSVCADAKAPRGIQAALIVMQPLDLKKNEIGPPRFAGVQARDAIERRIAIQVDLDPLGNKMPYWLRVWADGKHGGDFPIQMGNDPPKRLRKLNSATCYMNLTVLPRRK